MIPNNWIDELIGLGYTDGTLNDKMFNWLESKGYSGTLNDMMHAWLGDEGYTGVFGERLAKAVFAGLVPEATPAPSEPCKTLESPGIFGAGGAGAMAIDGLTATNTDGSLQGAHVKSTVAAPAVGERFLFEVHYNPLDWAGATGSNYVAIGDSLAADDAKVDLEGTDGQANSSLALAVFNDAGTLSHFIYDSSGALITFSSTTLTEHYAQVISEHAGGSVTFVTDKANFIVPVPTDPNFTDFDWCGNAI